MSSNNEATSIKLEVPANHKYLNVIGACINAMLDRIDTQSDRKSLKYNMELALHETCTNIIEHAYADKAGAIKIEFRLLPEPMRLLINLHDTGKPFDNLQEIPQPSLDEPQIRGYGLFITQQLVDEVKYFSENGSNRWQLMKRL